MKSDLYHAGRHNDTDCVFEGERKDLTADFLARSVCHRVEILNLRVTPLPRNMVSISVMHTPSVGMG